MRPWLSLLAATALPACLGAPETGAPVPGGGLPALQATYAAIDAVVLTPRCASAACHGGGNGTPLTLGTADAWAGMVGVPAQQVPELALVAPSDPASSYLLVKIQGRQGAAGGYGAPMPPDEALSDEEIAAIESWIRSGAPND